MLLWLQVANDKANSADYTVREEQVLEPLVEPWGVNSFTATGDNNRFLQKA